MSNSGKTTNFIAMCASSKYIAYAKMTAKEGSNDSNKTIIKVEGHDFSLLPEREDERVKAFGSFVENMKLTPELFGTDTVVFDSESVGRYGKQFVAAICDCGFKIMYVKKNDQIDYVLQNKAFCDRYPDIARVSVDSLRSIRVEKTGEYLEKFPDSGKGEPIVKELKRAINTGTNYGYFIVDQDYHKIVPYAKPIAKTLDKK